MERMNIANEGLQRAVMDEARANSNIAGIAVEKILMGVGNSAPGGVGRNRVKPVFEHCDGTVMSPEETLVLQCVHAASIGNSLGEEFLRKSPAALVEQFTTMAGNHGIADSGNMLNSLLHGFMVAFATRETEERAMKVMLEVARICNEANEIRGTSFGQRVG